MTPAIWHESTDLFVFHHTTPEAAEQIASTGAYVVGPARFLGPTGVHAGSDDPEAVGLEWVQTEYFFRLWPIEALGGVVVFRGDDELQPFERLTPNVRVLPMPIGRIDVADLVVGWGALDADGSWRWSPGLI